MKKSFTKIGIYCSIFLLVASAAQAQMADTVAEFKPSGKLWGYAFGDLAYKGSTDNIGTAAAPVYRGGSNQYTGMAANANMFQFRRIYLGYNYDISKHFSAEFLLAAEDDFNAGLDNQAAGDVLQNGKFSPYVKLANIRWKNLWHNSDLVIGQQSTPTFAKTGRNDQTSEEVWSYRSIERTITDIRRTPSYDMGASLQGWFDNKGCFGYTVLVGNGTSAKPETDNFKWFYGDVYAKFLDKRLIIDLYQDYEKLNWNPMVAGQAETKTTTTTYSTTNPVTATTTTSYGAPSAAGLHHDRNMTKLFVAWNTKKFTAGVEAFQNVILGDVQEVVKSQNKVYYATSKAMGVSVFVRGAIYKNKLGFFARYDNYDPSGDLSGVTGNKLVTSYTALTSTYNPTTKEQFATFGLDFTPIKNVHIMPNVWLNTYQSALSSSQYSLNGGTNQGSLGTDAVYRITFYYIYGK